jgi:hypothetical protein
LKTNYLYAAALWILAVVVLSAVPAKAQSGANTPEQLGNKVLAGIKAQNKDEIKSLIHPQVIEFMKSGNPGELDLVINNLLSLKVPPNTEFVVEPMEQVSEYDKTTQTLKFKDKTLYFPVAPSDLLVLVTEAEIPKQDENGVETKVKAKVGVMVNTITKYNGNWYIVLPVKKSEEKPEKPSEKKK